MYSLSISLFIFSSSFSILYIKISHNSLPNIVRSGGGLRVGLNDGSVFEILSRFFIRHIRSIFLLNLL